MRSRHRVVWMCVCLWRSLSVCHSVGKKIIFAQESVCTDARVCAWRVCSWRRRRCMLWSSSSAPLIFFGCCAGCGSARDQRLHSVNFRGEGVENNISTKDTTYEARGRGVVRTSRSTQGPRRGQRHVVERLDGTGERQSIEAAGEGSCGLASAPTLGEILIAAARRNSASLRPVRADQCARTRTTRSAANIASQTCDCLPSSLGLPSLHRVYVS